MFLKLRVKKIVIKSLVIDPSALDFSE